MTLARQTMLAIAMTASAVVLIASVFVRHALRETLDVFAPHFAMMRQMMGFAPDLRELYVSVDRAVVQSIVLAVALALLVSAWIGMRLARAVNAIDGGLARFAGGHFDRPITARGSADVVRIANAANTMATNLQSMRQAERELVAGVIHDLAHPITAMRGTLEQVRDGFAASSDPQVRVRLLDAVTSLEETIGALRDVAAADVGGLRLERVDVNLASLVWRSAAVYRDVAERRGVTLAVSAEAEHFVSSDATRLERLLANLVMNGIEATPPGGTVTLRSGRHSGRDVLCVEDEAGDEAAAKLRTLLHDRRGLGLGLRVVTAIADALGAGLQVRAGGRGSAISVTLPSAPV